MALKQLLIPLFAVIASLQFSTLSFAQDQRIVDSLYAIYKTDTLSGAQKMELLRNLAFNEKKDLEKSLSYAKELIALAEELDDPLYLHRGHIQMGNTQLILGNLDVALESYFKALEIAQNGTFLPGVGVGSSYMAIADVYSLMKDPENASLYYDKAIGIMREADNPAALANTLYNAGDHYYNVKQYDRALNLFEESESIFEQLGHSVGIAYTLGDIGRILAIQNRDEEAKEHLESAIEMLEELQDNYAIAIYLISLSKLATKNNDLNGALGYANRSLELAKSIGLKEQISEGHLQLYNLHNLAGNHEIANEHYKDHIVFRDSIRNVEVVQQMANLRTDYEIAQKQAEVNLLNQQRSNQRIVLWATGIVALLLSMMAIAMYRKNKFVQKTNQIIEAEQNRSESLLLNILPKQTAEELKEKGKVKAKKFESVTVLFTDFVDFSKYAEKLDPETLVKGMDYYYGKFDEIIEKYGLEKIKTVGDSYMCAGGIPDPDPDHAANMVKAAIEIVTFVENAKEARTKGKTRFDIRVGINSGPLVAGVVGTKKFAYDIWGDTVNVAARMENTSESGKINISENTYELVKNQFDCEFRGEIAAKNKGKLKMYFVKGKAGKEISKSVAKQEIKQKETPV